MSREVVIVSAVRTAVSSFQGALADISALQLGSTVIQEALKRANLADSQVDEVIMGNVLQAGLGQNPARQAWLKAGYSQFVPAMTINKVCGSGLKSVMLAAQSVRLGDADIVVAGGMENMTQAPYLLPGARSGLRLGDSSMVNSMIRDGLWCAMCDIHMGITAENIAEHHRLTRAEQDEFAAWSQMKAEQAIASGRFQDEIVSVTIPQRKGEPMLFAQDEFPRAGTTAEVLGKLRPAFKKEGTVTEGNASGINDGAAAVGRELGIATEKLNVNGGSIAIGHPIGASGARILVTLLHELEKRDSKLGVAALCIGGGQGVAMLVERG